MAAYIDDILGGSVQDTGSAAPDQARVALDRGIDEANGVKEAEETERKLVVKLRQVYQTARDFDKHMRDQFAVDRRYAAGKADKTWASDANIIGAFIDILVGYLYAKNPDVSSRAAAQVGAQPNHENTLFAETAQIVVSRLWKDARLKKAAKKSVRSGLSVGQGWFKAVGFSETKVDPQVQGQLRNMQNGLERLQAMEEDLNDPDSYSKDDRDVKIAEVQLQIAGLEAKLEKVSRAGLHIDFCRADDIQVSLDVADITEYLEADWLSCDLYITTDSVRDRFPRITCEEVKKATVYYQKQPQSPTSDRFDTDQTKDGGAFTKAQDGPVMGGAQPVGFAKVVELWDKRDGMIKTFIEGIDKWAVAPYAPPQATTRFYPFFLIALFEVDGERAPQSLTDRMRKLQDEYSATRSGGRLARERKIPGTIFNASLVTPEDAKKLETAVSQEYIGINPTKPDASMKDIFAPKPTGEIDPRAYDTSPVLSDMQMMSGVQEALAQGSTTAKTATEAGIEQSGFQSRTGTDRDTQEDVFQDFAQYTLEVALQEVPEEMAKRMAGPQAFWPFGMDVQDILALVSIDIDAGSTGKPNLSHDRESWGILLPQVKETMMQIRELQVTDPEMAKCLRNLLRETCRRLDDRMDIDELLPPMPPMLPGMPGMGIPGAEPVQGVGLPGAAAPDTMDSSTPVPPSGLQPV